MPIGLSFVLQGLADATPLQAFAAGAALCSTSLGTTFTVLATSGLTKSRLGVVLTSAAMMDDVVGLVMVQVISNLGGSGSSFSATTVIRPVFVSLAFAVLIPLVCRLIVKPATLFLNKHREANPSGPMQKFLSMHQTSFFIQTAILLGFVAGGSFAGTSNLFTAYLAGASISWWDAEVPHLPVEKSQSTDASHAGRQSSAGEVSNDNTSQVIDDGDSIRSQSSAHTSGVAIYERYYQQAVEKILKPLFFVSASDRLTLRFLTISAGLDWLFHSHFPDVYGLCCLAWNCIHNPDVVRETGMRSLASPLFCFAVHPRAS